MDMMKFRKHLAGLSLLPPDNCMLWVVGDHPRTLEAVRHELILKSLEFHGYNRTQTAKTLGVSKETVSAFVKQLRKSGFTIPEGDFAWRKGNRGKLNHTDSGE